MPVQQQSRQITVTITMKQILILLLSIVLPASAFATDTDPVYPFTKKLTPMKIRQRAARPDVPGTFLIEIGWNTLQNTPELMDMNTFGSRTVNLMYFWDVEIGNTGLFFMPGIGLGLERYKFDNDFTLVQNSDGEVSFSDISALDPKKSMLITNYVDIPIEFRYYINRNDPKRSFNFGFGGKFGYRFSSHTKLKFSEDGDDVITKHKRGFGLNRLRYGLTGRIGYGGLTLLGYFSLSDMFEAGNGPIGTDEVRGYTIGISFTGF